MNRMSIGWARKWVAKQARAMGEQYSPLHDDLARGIVNRLERQWGRIADDQVWDSLHLTAVNELRANAGLRRWAS